MTMHVAVTAAQSLSELQQKFDHEDNAVHRAKQIQKLGDAQFTAMHAAEKVEDYNTVGVTLEKYRDNVREALEGLKKEHPDAERRSNGYRQLQIHLRRGLREVEEALRAAPDEFKPPLQLVRTDLTSMDDELLILLFPKRLSTKPDPKLDPKIDPKLEPRLDPKPGPKEVKP
jgi:chromosome segregation ATPase